MFFLKVNNNRSPRVSTLRYEYFKYETCYISVYSALQYIKFTEISNNKQKILSALINIL